MPARRVTSRPPAVQSRPFTENRHWICLTFQASLYPSKGARARGLARDRHCRRQRVVRPRESKVHPGGPETYTGKNLLTAHKGMNIREQEYIAAIDDVLSAMEKHGARQPERDDVVAILYSLKGQVIRV